jgi:acetoin utilization protein AcuB
MSINLSTLRVGGWMARMLPVITPHTTVGTALRLLREHRLPALPVCDGGRFLGLVGERALLRLTPSEMSTLDVYELRNELEKLTVARAVSQAPAVAPDTSLDEAAAVMGQSAIEALPVVDNGRFVGLLHWTAVLAAVTGDAPAPSREEGPRTV